MKIAAFAHFGVRRPAQIGLPGLLVAILMLLIAHTPASAASARGISVGVPDDGPLATQLTGFDPGQVESVTYWVRGADNVWRHTAAVNEAPFEGRIPWWESDSSSRLAITAHVTLRSGHRVQKDPGGWRWVDGSQLNPGGTLAAQLNAGGTAAATYRPAKQGGAIEAVQFWLRDDRGGWHTGGMGAHREDASWTAASLGGSQISGWHGSSSAVTVHVIWKGGQETKDPTGWTTSFAPAPTPTPTPIPTPTPVPPRPQAPAVAQAPPAAAQAPPAAQAPAAGAPMAQLRAEGVSAICNDGSYSYSQHRSGTCSHHGGVQTWTGLI